MALLTYGDTELIDKYKVRLRIELSRFCIFFCVLQLSIKSVLVLVNLANQSLSQCQNASFSGLISRSKCKEDTATVTSIEQI